MKTRYCSLAAIVSFFILQTGLSPAQGTAFLYQGRLTDGGSAANGAYDLRFTIYDSTNPPGIVVAGPLTNSATAVSNGIFTLPLDFGAVFTGADRWLEIAVRTNGNGSFVGVSPRQRIAPVPYAITATSLAGVVANNTVDLTQFDTIGGGAANVANSNPYSTVGGGVGNHSIGYGGTIGGGYYNTNIGGFSTVAGGAENVASGFGSFIGGGGSDGITTYGNTASGTASSIVGGLNNRVSALFGSIGGGSNNVIQTSSMAAVISGGFKNVIGTNSVDAVIGGGEQNKIGTNAVAATVSGGVLNLIQDEAELSTIAGGFGNAISNRSAYSVVGGGLDNKIGNDDRSSVVAGGENNVIADRVSHSVVSGGKANNILSDTANSVIGGGASNTVSGVLGVVPGGDFNAATNSSFAAGHRAKANHMGSFVWADTAEADFATTASNQFLVRAAGGVGIGTGNPQGSVHIYSTNNPTVVRIQSTGTPGFGRVEFVSNPQGDSGEWRPGFIQSTDNGSFTGGIGFYVNGTGAGNRFATNEVMRIVNGNVGIGTANPTNRLQVATAYCTGTTWVNNSDRNLKENFAPVDAESVLAKIAAMPIGSWSYQTQPDQKHMGPMAQDFYGAFGLGDNERAISTVDEGGVALVAIQGLNEKVESGSQREVARIQKLETENAELEARVEKLERLLENKVATYAGHAR